MKRFVPKANPLRFALLGGAAVAAIGFLVAVALLLQNALYMVADEATRSDDSRAKEAISAALDLSLSHLADSVETNSVWDDAVTHTYMATLDKDWLYSSYGALAKTDGDYDAIYVVDAKGTILWGAANQKEDTRSHLSAVAFGLTPALIAPAALPGAKPMTRLVDTPKGPAFAGVGRIQPSSEFLASPQGLPRYLMLLRHIDSHVLRDYGHAYGVRNLALMYPNGPRGGAGRLTLQLKSMDGLSIGGLAWDSRHAGLSAARKVAPRIRFSLVLLAMFSVVVMTVIVWGLRRLRKRELEANKIARTDALTGLMNRGAFLAALQHCAGQTCGLALIDVDHFKALNESHGNGAGDFILKALACRLEAYTKQGHLIGRLGGDLFGLCVCEGAVEQVAQDLLTDVHDALRLPMNIGASQMVVSVTVGLAYEDHGTAEEVYRKASAALSHGKQTARATTTTYDSAIDKEITQRHVIERQLRDGLAQDEFEVFYQPIVSASSKEINSVEALVRWPRRPDGPLAPDVFISIAERCGAIHDLGLFVLRRACVDLLPFPHLKLSVNVSPAQFDDPRFLPTVCSTLQDLGFPASRLELEVTEGYMIDLPERAEKTIEALKAMGVSVALDDFGVGYSSIGYLRRFGFDKLKIDKSLAAIIGSDAKAGALVAATVAIAHALDIPVTAEGVETPEQAHLLHLAGCKNLQGYLYGRPASIGDLVARVEQGERATG